MDDEQRRELRRSEDRELLVDHSVRLGRLERDVSKLSDHVDRELDGMDLRFPTFDRVERDYVPRKEHRQRAADGRTWILVAIALGQLATGLAVVLHSGH